MAIANGSKYYMPPANVVTMAEDLAVLPVFLGESEDDWVLVRNLPDPAFMASVYEPLHLKAGFIQEAEAGILGEVKGEPWGWSPKMCHWLAERGMGEEWKTERKEWYSRRKAREGLIRLFGLIPDLEKEVIPETGYSIEEIEQKMKTGKYLVKAPWSSSGKGILVLGKPIAVKEKERLHGILKRQGYVMLEKKLNKVLDFAMEFCAGRQGVEFIGWSVFSTGLNGEYRGNYLGAQAYIEQLLGSKLGEEKLQSLKQELPDMIAGILPDQVPSHGEGVWVPLFGEKAYTMTFPLKLAKQFKAQIIMARMQRDETGWCMHVENWTYQLTGDEHQDAAAMNTLIERTILQCPQQYLWSYKRYKCPRGVKREQ